jgi:hypothetical protein
MTFQKKLNVSMHNNEILFLQQISPLYTYAIIYG